MESPEGKMKGTSRPENISTRLQRIAKLASEAPDMVFTTLAHHVDIELLQEAYRLTRKSGAAGVDGLTAEEYEENLLQLLNRFQSGTYKAPPVKRVYVPKGDGQKLRPIGIPTFEDKVLQRAVAMILEAIYEQDFLDCSYGYRPSRSPHGALKATWEGLMAISGGWVVEIDIKDFFDNISQKYILEAIGPVPGRQLIRRWLAAGYVENEEFHRTESGTGQGAIISSLLANIALDGMQRLLGNKFGFIRYADDFAVTAKSKEQLDLVIPTIEGWLAERGLALHPDKTQVVKVSEGFNFLGFNIRTYRDTCLTIPQKGKVLSLLRKLRNWLKDNKTELPENVLRHFNGILRGWCNYYKTGASSRVFGYVRHQIWRMLWKWCLHRHPNKSQAWVRNKYFAHINGDSWTFHTLVPVKGGLRVMHIFQVSRVKIERHVKVADRSSPDDPSQREYWLKRLKRGSRYALNSDEAPNGMRA